MNFIRNLAASALALLTAYRVRIISFLVALIPVTVDGALGALTKVVARLDRAVAQTESKLEAEYLLQAASRDRVSAVRKEELAIRSESYAREDALATDLNRAKAARARVAALLG